MVLLTQDNTLVTPGAKVQRAFHFALDGRVACR
jgi:hypothetical protein